MKRILIILMIIFIVGCASSDMPSETDNIQTDTVLEDDVVNDNTGNNVNIPSEINIEDTLIDNTDKTEAIESSNNNIVESNDDIISNGSEPKLESPTLIGDLFQLEILENLHFSIEEADISAGTTMKLTNNGRAAQKIIVKAFPYNADKLWKLERLLNGNSIEFTFEETGVYHVYGTTYPALNSVITVK